MHKIFLVVCLMLGLKPAFSQKKPVTVDANGNLVGYEAFTQGGIGITLTIDEHTNWIHYNQIPPNSPNASYTFLNGTKSSTINISVPTEKIGKYRFNVFENDSTSVAVNVPLSSLQRKKSLQKISILTIGKLDIEKKKITIEVFRSDRPREVLSATIYNKEIPSPKLLKGAVGLHIKKQTGSAAVQFLDSKKKIVFKLRDSVDVLGMLVGMNPTGFDFLYHASLRNLTTGKTLPLDNNWQYGFIQRTDGPAPYLVINSMLFEDPGDYEIRVEPRFRSSLSSGDSNIEQSESITFKVIPGSPIFSSRQLIVWSIGVSLLVALVGAILYQRKKREYGKKLFEKQRTKELVEMRLEALRLQLNPHFLFNALSNIQNLINKKELDQANRYLSRFARLTRNVLEGKNEIALDEEVRVLEDYLEMERLRFGFEYAINIDKNINISNIEIPSMLLQPCVENAVKHGITGMTNGKIEVSVKRRNSDLTLLIADNGQGYKPNEVEEGHGIGLLKKRIELFNSIYKLSSIDLKIRSFDGGTSILIELNNWLE